MWILLLSYLVPKGSMLLFKGLFYDASNNPSRSMLHFYEKEHMIHIFESLAFQDYLILLIVLSHSIFLQDTHSIHTLTQRVCHIFL